MTFRGKAQGFSLIEVLIAMAVLVIGILGLIKLQVYIEKQAEFAEKSIQALHLSESKLEYFRTRSVSGGNGTVLFSSIQSDSLATTVHGFTTSWQVTDLLSGTLKSIEIETRWVDRWGQQQSIKLTSMLSQYSEFDQ